MVILDKISILNLDSIGGHEYYTRGRNKLRMPTHRLTFLKKPRLTLIKLLNDLPQEILKLSQF